MKEYRIKTLHETTNPFAIDWNTIQEEAKIDTYSWLPGKYEPVTSAKLVYIQNQGFVLHMTCEEQNPKAVYHAYNEPVYTDSCMEFFAQWMENDSRYINMEMNSNGTLLSCIGPGRGDRKPIKDVNSGNIFDVRATVEGHAWSITAYIGIDDLARIYGSDAKAFQKGYTFKGNFYKCGDETEVPHYGMWNPVELEKADFHRPEFFGSFIIV